MAFLGEICGFLMNILPPWCLLLIVLGGLGGLALCLLALARGDERTASHGERAASPTVILLTLSLLCFLVPVLPLLLNASRWNALALVGLLQPIFLTSALTMRFLPLPPQSRVRNGFTFLDSMLLALSMALVVWWVGLEPLALVHRADGDSTFARLTFLLLFHLAALIFIAVYSVDIVVGKSARRVASTRDGENETPASRSAVPAPGRLSVGAALALIAIGLALLLSRSTPPVVPSLLLALSQIALGASVLLAWNAAPETQQEERDTVLPTSSAFDETQTGSVYNVMVAVLPCLTIAVGVAHLLAPPRLGSHAGTAEAVLLYVLLLTAALRQATLGVRNRKLAQQVLQEGRELRAQVARRTRQLATVHAVAADLNNSLNRELVLSTALDRMIEAAGADAGAVWLRAEHDKEPDPADSAGHLIEGHGNNLEIGSFGPNGSGDINEIQAFEEQLEAARREHQQQDASTRAVDSESERRNTRRRLGLKSSDPKRALKKAEERWALVRASGQERDAQRHALEKMGAALERGGLSHCAQTCETDPVTFGSAHVVPIRWSGKLMGVAGVLRWQESFDESERDLVQSIAIEAGAALQNAYLYQEARRRADLDGVTDLFNHRSMQEKLNAEINRARKGKNTLTIVMMDLNNFKFFNDTYGHPVGDSVLRKVADCLRDTCRADDVLGRYGGDEFIALLTDTDARGALEVCARIAARVEETAYIEVEGRRIPISLSFGAAVYPHDGEVALELLTLADANLYEAKRGGAPLMIQRNTAEETQELRQLKNVGVGGSFGVLDALVTAIDNKDHYTRRHSEDVAHWATLMVRQLGHSADTQRAVRICGLLHDVGKIAVPDAVLRKPGRLNDDEFNIMQQHPVFGALIVKDVPNLEEVLGGIRHHHERFDGKGYPDKLKEEAIPFMGRLLAVPDCFSAMTTDRPYRKALSWVEALDEIERGKGTQFDPVMADAFLEIIAKIIADRNSRVLGSGDARQSVVQISDFQPEDDGPTMAPRSVADAVASGSPQKTVAS